jgi:trehalose monomycolate/heme transporter
MTITVDADRSSTPPLPAPAPRSDRLGRRLQRWRWPILGAAALFLAVSVIWGTGVFGRLSGGGFDTPGSESSRAGERIEGTFGRQDADVAIVYASDTATVADPAFRTEVEQTLADVPAELLAQVTTLWSPNGSPALVSEDERQTLVLLQVAGADEAEREETYRAIADLLVADELETYRGGAIPTFLEVNDQIEQDLSRAETLSAPILLVLLVLVFGSLAAASLPLAIGLIAILGAFTTLNLISQVTDVSVYSINIVIMLGLGLAIDYALFIVSRFREEMRALGNTRAVVASALGRTMVTAGRTVLFSGITVAVSLAALLFFSQGFLRSMGYGAIAAVLVALVAALTVLPALLAVLGPRVDALRIRRRRAPLEANEEREERGAWARLARAVMRRPGIIAAGLTAALVVLALPFLNIAWGGVDYRVLPEGSESRIAGERINGEFPLASTSSLDVVVTGASGAEVEHYAQQLGSLEGATGARVVGTSDGTTLVSVGLPGDPSAEPAQDLVGAVREVPAPEGAEVLVGGAAAVQADTLASLGERLPWAGGFVIVATMVLLFLAFGSLLLPVKAVVMAALSLSAMFGVIVWVFQEGNLASWFNVTTTGTIEATQPVIMVAIAFGLSMDYEVFLLSRIREEWDRTHDNTRAVAVGLQRTGRIITSAALLLVVVIGAFATSGISFITMIGVGLAFAILLDATVIRGLLVPATMRLLGRANWWAPRPLLRAWERFGIREAS